MSETYTELLEKDFARQIKFNHVEDYHKLGYKGKDIVIFNAESLTDHGQMTTKVINDYAPEATVYNGWVSSKTSGGKIEYIKIHINKEELDFEEAIDKYNIKIMTISMSGSYPKTVLEYYKDVQKRKGIIMFCSAGNEGDDVGLWAKNNTAIAVSASTLKENGEIKISYYGSLNEVDFTCFMARGRGTSASSPALSALTALLLNRYGDFNQEECVEILKSIAIDLGDRLRAGWGLPILPLTDKLEILDELRKNTNLPIENIEPELPKEEKLEDVKNEGENMKKVMIDSGHYPNHPNKGQTGYWEYQGVWKISNYLKEFLEKQGIQADLTKTYEETFNKDKDLTIRGKKAQDYDLFISEHSNANDDLTVRGVECFYDFSKPEDKFWANELSKAVSELMNNPNRGAKTRTYVENGKTLNYYGVIRGASATNCPHIFLIESGFHSNLIDEAFLKIDDNLKKIAEVQAKIICKILGVEYKEGDVLNYDDAKKLLKENANIDDNSIQYLEYYRYGEDLIKKLAVPMVNNIVVEESIIEPPKLIKPKVEFSKTVNNTFMLYSDVENLKVKEVNKSNGILLEENYVNSTFFWSTTDGKKYSTSILYADGITYQSNANHLPYPQDTFIINKDNSVEMKRIKSLGELNLSKVKIAIAGVGLIDKTNSSFVYDPAGCGFKGVYADVLRKTNKTMIVYNKSEDKLYLVCRPNIYHQSSLYYDLIDLAGDIGDIACAFDGGGSTTMGANGKIVVNGDGRVIHSILYF